MKILQSFLLEKQINASNVSPKKILIGIILLCLVVFGLTRACSSKIGVASTVYQIGRDGTFTTLMVSEKEKNLSAFTNDLFSAIAAKENIQFQFIQVDPAYLFDGLDRRNYDAIISGFHPFKSRFEKYESSNPYYLLGPVLIVRASSPVTSLREMKGKIIGIQTGSSIAFNLEQFTDILITSYDSPLQALSSLDKDIIDGVILNVVSAYIYTTNLYAGRLRIATRPLTDDGLRLISYRNPRSEELLTQFNRGIAAIKEDGSYQEMLDKWGLINPDAVVQPPIPSQP